MRCLHVGHLFVPLSAVSMHSRQNVWPQPNTIFFWDSRQTAQNCFSLISDNSLFMAVSCVLRVSDSFFFNARESCFSLAWDFKDKFPSCVWIVSALSAILVVLFWGFFEDVFCSTRQDMVLMFFTPRCLKLSTVCVNVYVSMCMSMCMCMCMCVGVCMYSVWSMSRK